MIVGFVALTLSPMMSSLLLKHRTKHRLHLQLTGSNAALRRSPRSYKRLLNAALDNRLIVVLVALIVAAPPGCCSR